MITRHWTDLIFETWVSDPKNDGDYVLNLTPEETKKFFEDLVESSPKSVPPQLADERAMMRLRGEELGDDIHQILAEGWDAGFEAALRWERSKKFK